MKSNQERSNESLPPKKRELPATSRPSEEKPIGLTTENHRTESLAWLPGTPSCQSSMGSQHGAIGVSVEAGLQHRIGLHKSLSAGMDYSPPSAPRSAPATTMLPAVYQSVLSQSGTPVSPMQYTHLPQTFQFVGPQYSGSYAGFIPTQLIPSTSNSSTGVVASTAAGAPTPSQPSHMEAYSSMLANMRQPKGEQHVVRTSGLLSAGSPPPHSNQYVHISSSPQSALRPPSPPTIPVHVHSLPAVIPHALTLTPSSQVLVQYTDSGGHFIARDHVKKAESSRQQAVQAKEMLNGEMEKGRRYSIAPSADTHMLKAGNNKAAPQHYETRHVMVHPSPAEYSARDSSGIRTSVMVVPNSNTPTSDMEVQQNISREASPSAVHNKGGLHLGKTAHRSYGLSPQQTLCHESVKAVATLSPHTVIQTTHSAPDQLSVGLPATAFYAGTQQPLIGYLSSQQQAIGYPGNLPQHLVIPGTQSLLIPVGNADVETTGVAPSLVTSSPQFAAVPQTFVTTAIPKNENFSAESLANQPAYQAAVVQAQIHLPVVQSIASPTATPPTLPPYFMKGSIIQLANGELKKVEDLKTEDFIQSAEISNDLKIDSSTVERIDDSHSPDVAVIQFAVGEHRAQVSVEVLVEYPFFVFGQGWSSCCPERTSQLFDLPCSRLSVGDVCISLTLKNLKNGSIKKGQPMDSASILLKHPKSDGLVGSRHRYVEQENGINQGSAQMLSENGELKFPDKIGFSATPLLTKTEPNKPVATRKRRWSAPETRKVEKSEEEQPLTLPKPSFIPQEVKICIEGRSNVGK
ncbi:ataxin-1 [Rhinatrema bivittatum]|uniref:ataxin-1 n=1 Tax=Rhinatrema bivittatum TaxID=194408 RepID=UPI00112C9DB4|nr:ataxin-1 [Rhinatrema bivittatum]XP_029446558.1 ataxin-1 [Rhinatrema bivittatum]XP_029446560.1 ataxin-1 [Rhinatrema bivittatum]XP_029446561.1 ataxin-1 [Rhinatrema bivittatum]XP_029446562.1 ataxin-1 [Rhinatrema bivittatum]